MAVGKQGNIDSGALFYALAQDIKTPLVRIAYKAELAGSDSSKVLGDIHHAANTALAMLDAYILGIHGVSQASLVFEPVSPSAVLADTAYELKDFAKRFACELHLDIPHGTRYALTNKNTLQTALSAVCKVFIEAQNIIDIKHKSVTLASYKTKDGYAVGVFGHGLSDILDTQLLSKARAHVGKAARPFAGLASGASSQLFVAEQLAHALDTTFRSARRGAMHGLAIDLIPSSQLKLV